MRIRSRSKRVAWTDKNSAIRPESSLPNQLGKVITTHQGMMVRQSRFDADLIQNCIICTLLQGCKTCHQSWALSVFLIFSTIKNYFLHFFVKLIWLGVGILNRNGAEIGYLLYKKCKKNHFLLVKKLKNTGSAQLCLPLNYAYLYCSLQCLLCTLFMNLATLILALILKFLELFEKIKNFLFYSLCWQNMKSKVAIFKTPELQGVWHPKLIAIIEIWLEIIT